MRKNTRLFWKLITIASVLFLLISGVWFLFNSTSDSKQLEQQLNDRFGWADEFVPAPDGVVLPGRIERFIRVRQAVQPACRDFADVMDGVIAMDAIEDDPDITGEESAGRVIRGVKSVFRVGPRMLRFMDARNSELLAENMGLGEYIYLYLSAYEDQLANADTSRYAGMDEAYVSERTREEFTQILNNQLSALGPTGSVSVRIGLESWIEALEATPDRGPWPAGSLPATRESLAPFEDRLSGLYCTGLVGMELLQKNRGFRLGG
jgi:Fe-S-cluster formation regulator IscX/YfhJ